MVECWIFDIDGTLADTSARQPFLADGKKDWAGWFRDMDKDPVHADVVQFLDYALDRDITVFICTGRDEGYREVTETWLDCNDIGYEDLFMRPAGDRRDDSIVKKEMLDMIRGMGYNPTIAFDDRDRVVKMWRENGVRCFQVAPGDF